MMNPIAFLAIVIMIHRLLIIVFHIVLSVKSFAKTKLDDTAEPIAALSLLNACRLAVEPLHIN